MMNVLIISKNRMFAKQLKNDLLVKLSQYCDDNQYSLFLNEISLYELKHHYDLAFIDIQDNIHTCLEIGKHLQINKICNRLIFISDDPHYVFQTFDVLPMFFIRKQNYKEDLYHFFVILDSLFDNKSFYVIKENGQKIVLDTEQIIYVNVDNRYLNIHLKNNTYLDICSLKNFVSLNNQVPFIQINKSTAVNFAYVLSFSSYEVTLINHIVFPIGRAYRDAFKKCIDSNHPQKVYSI